MGITMDLLWLTIVATHTDLLLIFYLKLIILSH